MESLKSSYLLLPVVLFISILASSCASLSDLPSSEKEVKYSGNNSKWNIANKQYEECVVFLGSVSKDIFPAAKYALTRNHFAVQTADLERGTVRGEQGASGANWNTVTGVYFKDEQDGVAVKVIVRTAKNFSLYKDDESSDVPRSILKDIKYHIESESLKNFPTVACAR